MRQVVALFVLLGAAPAFAVDLQERCSDDQLPTSQLANLRNQWALGCHLISKIDYDCAQTNGYYWTFISTVGGPNRAPTHPSAACAGFKKFTMCPSGCFAARQRLLFDGEYMTPEDAFHAGRQTVTTLAADASIANLKLVEEPIGSFVQGPEKKDLVRIALMSGETLSVTQNHPMVQADGQIVPASAVGTGQMLLTTHGPVAVESVAAEPYDGLVWNVKPVKKSPKANIDIAQGVLSGSIRYQNEWANEAARLLLRHDLNVSGL